MRQIVLVKIIKKLPKTFYFKSKINPFNILYKAEKDGKFYKVKCAEDECGGWLYIKEDLFKRVKSGDYIIVPKPDYIKD